jgi:hypothetical protein
MLASLAGALVVLSVAILISRALDAFRSGSELNLVDPTGRRGTTSIDSEGDDTGRAKPGLVLPRR